MGIPGYRGSTVEHMLLINIFQDVLASEITAASGMYG